WKSPERWPIWGVDRAWRILGPTSVGPGMNSFFAIGLRASSASRVWTKHEESTKPRPCQRMPPACSRRRRGERVARRGGGAEPRRGGVASVRLLRDRSAVAVFHVEVHDLPRSPLDLQV